VAIVSTTPPALQTCEPGSLEAPALLRLWHLASLDAPTVAVVWTLAFAWAAGIRLPLWLTSLLALAAWCVYVADRLLDARNANTPLRARHHFHWKYRRLFAPLGVLAAIAALALVLHSMPFAARERNSVLAAAALAYFTSVHSPWRVTEPKFRFPKEFLVGILFTAACAAPTVSRIGAHWLPLLPAILIFMALAWLNCHAIESWESGFERRFTILRVASGLATGALIASVLSASAHHPRMSALLGAAALSATLLAALDSYRHRLTPVALRVYADLALLAPVFLLAVR
jgi:hypothetical protein